MFARWNWLLIWAILILALVTPYVGGVKTAYLLIIVCLVFIVSNLLPLRNYWKNGGGAALCFLGAFLLLGVAFIANAKEYDDPVYIFNFSMFVLYAPIAYVLSRYCSSFGARWVVALALLGVVVASGVAFYQVFGLGDKRAAGYGSDPIWSSEAVTALSFLALIGVTIFRERWRFVFVLAPILGIVVDILAGSRGPLTAVPMIAIVYVLVTTRRWMRNVLIGLGLIAVCIGVVWVTYPPAMHRFVALAAAMPAVLQGRDAADGSIGQRQVLYSAGLQAFAASPILGHGWHEKMQAIVPYLPKSELRLAKVHQHLHSDILDFIVSAGLLGLLAYILVIVAPIVGAWQSPRDSQFHFRMRATIVLSASYATLGLTYLLFGYEFHTTLYVVLAAILVGYCRDPVDAASEAPAEPEVPAGA